MESIGERLRAARERKNIDLEQVARETNIMKRYLSALENEDFQAFPGEPYLLGFLKNYADYLGLDSAEIVNSYRNLKIQEQPIPVQQLLEREKKSPIPFLIGGGAAVLLVGIGLFVWFGVISPAGGSGDLAAGRNRQEYVPEAMPFEKRLFEGDSVVYSYNADKYKIVVDSIKDAIVLKTPAGDARILLGEEATIDLDRNGIPELKAFVSDYAKADPQKGAMIRFADYAEIPAAPPSDGAVNPAAAATAVGQGDASAQIPKTDTTQVDASKPQILVEAKGTPYPFTMNVTFRGHCMFRYEKDRKERDERYYRKGEQISASANDTMKIWISNATSSVISVTAGGKTANLDVGAAGEVVVKQIKWVKTDAGNFTLAAYNVN